MTEQPGDSHMNDEFSQRLRQALPEKPELSADFESRVLTSVKGISIQKANRKRVMIIMMAYWSVALTTGFWLLGSATVQGGSLSFISAITLLGTFGLIGVSMAFLAKQSRMRISELFLKTIIQ